MVIRFVDKHGCVIEDFWNGEVKKVTDFVVEQRKKGSDGESSFVSTFVYGFSPMQLIKMASALVNYASIKNGYNATSEQNEIFSRVVTTARELVALYDDALTRYLADHPYNAEAATFDEALLRGVYTALGYVSGTDIIKFEQVGAFRRTNLYAVSSNDNAVERVGVSFGYDKRTICCTLTQLGTLIQVLSILYKRINDDAELQLPSFFEGVQRCNISPDAIIITTEDGFDKSYAIKVDTCELNEVNSIYTGVRRSKFEL